VANGVLLHFQRGGLLRIRRLLRDGKQGDQKKSYKKRQQLIDAAHLAKK